MIGQGVGWVLVQSRVVVGYLGSWLIGLAVSLAVVTLVWARNANAYELIGVPGTETVPDG